MDDEPPVTGAIDLIPRPAEEGEMTYVLLPILDGLGDDAFMSVFADGSYTKWVPRRSSRRLD